MYAKDVSFLQPCQHLLGNYSIGGRCVSNLRYADDVAIAFTLLQNINLASQQYNLDMNVKKIKIMTCAKSDINADIHLMVRLWSKCKI